MISPPKLSIITINLNNQTGLEQTLQSIYKQTCNDYEIIVVDGGSDDGSINVIKKYNKIIHKWVSEKDNGIYNAMNKGIGFAEGEYCFFLNSGDILADEEVLEKIFLQKPDADIFYGDVIVVDSLGRGKLKEGQNQPTDYFLFLNTICHQVQFIKKNLFEKINDYDEQLKLASDYDFLLRAVVKNRASIKFYPVIVSRHFADGLSNQRGSDIVIQKERKVAQRRNFPLLICYYYAVRRLCNAIHRKGFWGSVNLIIRKIATRIDNRDQSKL